MSRFSLRTSVGVAVASLAFALFANMAAAKDSDSKMISDADGAIAAFEKSDPGMKAFLAKAPGYVVFPGIGKGGLGVGGAHGNGVLYEGGKPVGTSSLTQVNIGLQAGGQKFAEVIVFETAKDLAKFKTGDFSFSGNVSAVALKSGVSATAKFENGVAVFTQGEKGLMYEASVGGQKFKYEPLGGK
jgi:lipid-binding SYLF domain-containing protein